MDKMKKVKKKRKMAKNLTLPHWDLNPEFLNKTFPPKIWILREITSIELTVLKKSWLYLKMRLQKHFDPILCVLAYLCIRKTAALVVDWQMCAKNQRELACKCGGHSLKSTYHRLKSAFKLNKLLAMKFPNYFLSLHSMLRQIFNKKSKVRPKTPTASKVIP